MATKMKNRWTDLAVSLLLGVTVCALLGYLIGLRILNWNPDLIVHVRNVIFLLLSTTYLYALLGLGLGVVLWISVRVYARIKGEAFTGRAFLGPWVAIFLLGATLVCIFLMLTRQGVRTGNFDNLLLVIYYLSLLFLGFWFHRSVRFKPDPLSGRSRLFTLPKFFLVFAVYLIFALGYTLITVSRVPDTLVKGDPKEIQNALSAANPEMRVAVFGWDGAEWSVINDLFDKGYLPNLKRLVDNGVSAPLRSLEVLKSPLIWTSIATGKLPEKHGVEDFGSFQFAGMASNFLDYPDGLGLYRLITLFQRSADLPVTSSMRRCQALWNLLSDAHVNLGLVGWWATWPAEPVNGFILSDRFTYTLFNPRASVQSLTAGQSYPPDLISEVSRFCRLPNSVTDAELSRFIPAAGKEAYPQGWQHNQYEDWNPMYQFRMAYTASESFREAGLYLYQKSQPAFFGIYFEGIDMVSHFFWQYYRPQDFSAVPAADIARFGRVLPEFYQYTDEILGQYMSQFSPNTNIIVLSDHGFGPDTAPRIPYRTGDHRPYGVFVASGPQFQVGRRLEHASVLDITPTLLHLYGLPVGQDMDGKVLTEALDPLFLQAHPLRTIKSYETGQRVNIVTRSATDAQVRDQIKALGYTQ